MTIGYIAIWQPTHPLAAKDGYVMEHRKVAWDAGLLTDPSMQVHHIDHDRANNALSNLVVLDQSAHLALHHQPGELVRNQYGTFVVLTPEERLEKGRARCREYQRKRRALKISQNS